ncbi:hypothetical protein [Streptomyces griseoflavus]|uniref:hypothetical protein n=1 Tax=Streptomyces griseoflavus TaxID=35619 RepID=UPI0001B4C4E8|nr:hypothetical protein [Streptomyces griseoflavus]
MLSHHRVGLRRDLLRRLQTHQSLPRCLKFPLGRLDDLLRGPHRQLGLGEPLIDDLVAGEVRHELISQSAGNMNSAESAPPRPLHTKRSRDRFTIIGFENGSEVR